MNWIKLRLANDGTLLCSAGDKAFEEVVVRPCFPLSRKGEFLALIGKDGREVGLVESPANLDLESRKALQQAQTASEFTIAVNSVGSVSPEGDIFVWELQTEIGFRKIQTRAGEWPRKLEDGSSLVEDLAGDLYQVPPLDKLDKKSRVAVVGMID